MEGLWIQSLHNLHCPRCDERLVQQAARVPLPGRQVHVYVGEVGTLACPAGHRLPDRESLYDYRARAGHAWRAEVTEVSPPRRRATPAAQATLRPCWICSTRHSPVR